MATEIVPFGIGLAVAPRTGDAIGDTSRGRSVSEGGVISVERGGGGWYGGAADADISRCHSRQERFSRRRPSWTEFLHLVNTNRGGRSEQKEEGRVGLEGRAHHSINYTRQPRPRDL